jgi:hypothetical protein
METEETRYAPNWTRLLDSTGGFQLVTTVWLRAAETVTSRDLAVDEESFPVIWTLGSTIEWLERKSVMT